MWSARFYVVNPFEWDLPKLEDFPGARYIIYKLFKNSPNQPVTLEGYVQFSAKKTYDELNEISIRYNWYKQTVSNTTTIRRIKTVVPRSEQVIVQEAVELGEAWPTKEPQLEFAPTEILKRPVEDEQDSQPTPKTPSPRVRTPSPSKIDLENPPSPPKLQRTRHMYYKKVAPTH